MKTTKKGTVLLNLWKKGRTRGSVTQVNKFRFYKKCNKECKREKNHTRHFLKISQQTVVEFLQ